MKKTFTIAAMICAGLSFSSCGDTSLVNALVQTGASVLGGTDTGSTKYQLVNVGAQVLTGLLANGNGAQQGTKQDYSGAYTAQLLTYGSNGYQEAGKAASTTATTTLYVQNTGATGITIPAITANGASMTQVSLTNLTAQNGTYKLSDSSTVTEGKLTYNGQTYDLANAYVELTYSGTASCSYTASIYFNYNESKQQYMYAMNVTFKK